MTSPAPARTPKALDVQQITPDSASVPFGTSFLPTEQIGVDLAPHDYIEEEFMVSGTAGEWSYDEQFALKLVRTHRYRTRVLVRRPRNTEAASGTVHLEALHPERDSAFSWRYLHPWIIRNGHTWVGITHDRTIAEDLRALLPERYGWLSIPAEGLHLDMIGDIGRALKSATFPGCAARRIVLSGWSMTGSYARTYLQEGFNERHAWADGAPIDAAALCISAGAAGWAGYPPLSANCPLLPLGHPRRTMNAPSIPVIEILSECESEQQEGSLRDDADEPHDRYRLYQVAGTSHLTMSEQLEPTLTNLHQYRAAGGRILARRVHERSSDARLEYVARALFDHLERWLTEGLAPPSFPRFTWEVPHRERRTPVHGIVRELARDGDGNVLGGIRPPWIAVPLATYLPHSTPVPGYCLTGSPDDESAGLANVIAALYGNASPFTRARARALYGSESRYRELFAESVAASVDSGFLLREEAALLTAEFAHAWDTTRDDGDRAVAS